MSKNENEFEFYGKVYVAKDHPEDDIHCVGCDLYPNCFSEVAKCTPDERLDFKNVIFVEKQQ